MVDDHSARRIRFSQLTLIYFAIILLISITHANDIQVRSGESIQWAIDSAKPCDTIVIHNGTYHECLNIDKQLTIKGEGMPVIYASKPGSTITLNANRTIITGLIITNLYMQGTGIDVLSCDNIIRDCRASQNDFGIMLESSNNTLNKNILEQNEFGIGILGSGNNTIEENRLLSNQFGLVASNSSGNYLSNNNATNNTMCGIYFINCTRNTVADCISRGNANGIKLDKSNNNTVMNNSIELNFWHGLYLGGSIGNILRNNNISSNMYNFDADGYNSIDESNLADGKSVQYLINKSDLAFDSNSNVSAIYCIDCTNISIRNLSLSNCGSGIDLQNNSNCLIENNSVRVSEYGILLNSSRRTTILRNTIQDSKRGLFLYHSNNSRVSENILSGNEFNFGLVSIDRNGYNNNIEPNNLADEKPILYLTGERDMLLDQSTNVASIYCIDCENISIMNLTLHNNTRGICFYNTTRSHIQKCQISNNYDGIILINSSENRIEECNTSCNMMDGISLSGADRNMISSNDAMMNGYDGFHLVSSGYNIIEFNNASENEYHGIHLQQSNTNNMYNISASLNTWYGLYISESNDNRLTFIDADENYCGIYLDDSVNNKLTHSFMNDNIYNFNGIGYNSIDVTNKAEGKPIYYLVNVSNQYIGPESNASLVYCLNCTNITVSGLQLSNAVYALFFSNSSECLAKGNLLSDSLNGIRMLNCSSIGLEDNRILNCSIALKILGSNNSTAKENIINNCTQEGILIGDYSSGCDIKGNILNENWVGIGVYDSARNAIVDNVVCNSSYEGIILSGSKHNTLIRNKNQKNSVGISLIENSSQNNVSFNQLAINYFGIGIYNSNDNLVQENIATKNGLGINIEASRNNTIRSNDASQSEYDSIMMIDSSKNVLNSNNASRSWYGIYMNNCSENILEKSILIGNYHKSRYLQDKGINANAADYVINCGIIMNASNDNIITNNLASNCNYGIALNASSNNTLKNNSMYANEYNFWSDGFNDVDISNTVDGRPIYYLVNASDVVIGRSSNAGMVVCINCKNATIRDLSIEMNYNGIDLSNTSDSKIINNSISQCYSGIYLKKSNNNTIAGNTAISIKNSGLVLYESKFNMIYSNNASKNLYNGTALYNSSNNTISANSLYNNNNSGIYLEDSRDNLIQNNNLTNNFFNGMTVISSSRNNVINNSAMHNSNGMVFIGSKENIIENNSAFENSCYGLSLNYSGNNVMKSNILGQNQFNCGVNGENFSDLNNSIDTSNIANGKPIYFLVNASNLVLDASIDPASIDCLNCNNITVKDQNLSGFNGGICFYLTNNSSILNNNLSRSSYGIQIYRSFNNTIVGNNGYDNQDGIIILNSAKNTFKKNDFHNNTNNFYIGGSTSALQDNDIDISNVVDGKPIYYLFNASNRIINESSSAGVVCCIGCNNITIKGLSIANSTYGIYLFETNNSSLMHNAIDKSGIGIYLIASNRNDLSDNIVNCSWVGISLELGNNNRVESNKIGNITYNGIGDNNTIDTEIIANNITKSWIGIALTKSKNSILDANAISQSNSGIVLSSVEDVALKNNIMIGNNYSFDICGETPFEFNNDIDTSNLIDGKPMCYLVGATNMAINNTTQAGAVYCIGCNNVTVEGQEIRNNTYGIYFYKTANSIIKGNRLSNNWDGINLQESNNNRVETNSVCNNSDDGIEVRESESNSITNNTAYNNWYGIFIYKSNNTTIADNNASNNLDSGLYFRESCRNYFFENQAINNTIGIQIDPDHDSIGEGNIFNYNDNALSIDTASLSEIKVRASDYEDDSSPKTSSIRSSTSSHRDSSGENKETNSGWDQTDRMIKNNTNKGTITFRPEENMTVNEPSEVTAYIAISNSTGEAVLYADLEEDSGIEHRSIPITRNMSLSLTAIGANDTFKIVLLSEEWQTLVEDYANSWTWTVTPKRPGKNKLILSAISEPLPGKSAVNKVFERTINVTAKSKSAYDWVALANQSNEFSDNQKYIFDKLLNLIGVIASLFSVGGVGWLILKKAKIKK